MQSMSTKLTKMAGGVPHTYMVNPALHVPLQEKKALYLSACF